jgi:hypothetical protein
LEQAVAKYFSLQSQISAGLTFYSNLQVKQYQKTHTICLL